MVIFNNNIYNKVQHTVSIQYNKKNSCRTGYAQKRQCINFKNHNIDIQVHAYRSKKKPQEYKRFEKNA